MANTHTPSIQKGRILAIDGSERNVHPQEYVDAIVRDARTSFTWPMLLQGRKKREAIHAIYAFCRLIDDIVDGAGDSNMALRKLDFFQQQIDAIYSQHNVDLPTHPVTKALLYHIRTFNLPKEPFDCVIAGCRMDALNKIYKPSLKDLEQYCYDIASSVGLLSIEVFGYKHEDTKCFAINLGKSMQLINIIRDVFEDARRNRIYLPWECLARVGLSDITPQHILEKRYDPALGEVYTELAHMSRHYATRAMQRLNSQDTKTMRPALFMGHIYMHYLAKMEKQQWLFKRNSLKLNFIEKLKIARQVFG